MSTELNKMDTSTTNDAPQQQEQQQGISNASQSEIAKKTWEIANNMQGIKLIRILSIKKHHYNLI